MMNSLPPNKFTKTVQELLKLKRQVRKATKTMNSVSGKFSSFRNFLDDVDHNIIDQLRIKLDISEKRILKTKGKHPRKDRTYNLINYMDTLTDEEIRSLVKILSKEIPDIHEGMIPFMNRNLVLENLYIVRTTSDPRTYYGFNGTSFIPDGRDAKMDYKAEKQKSKQKLTPRR